MTTASPAEGNTDGAIVLAAQSAFSTLSRRRTDSASEAELDRARTRLDDLHSRLEFIRAGMQQAGNAWVPNLDRAMQEVSELRGLLDSVADIKMRDYADETLPGDQSLNAYVGQLVPASSRRDLSAQTDGLTSILPDNTLDGPQMQRISAYTQYLHVWWQKNISPLADLLYDASQLAESLATRTSFSPALEKVLNDEASRRNARLSAQLKQTLADQKLATTEIGEGELTRAFKEVHDDALCGARLWTSAVALLVALGIFAPFFAFWLDPEFLKHIQSDTSALLIKALSGLPLYALAAYSGHIAAQHRETARHLTILNAQIKTVRAYTTSMPDQERLDLRMALGMRAFTDPGFTKHDDGNVSLIPPVRLADCR